MSNFKRDPRMLGLVEQPSAGKSGGKDSLNLFDVLAVLWRGKFILFVCMFLFASVAVYRTIAVIEPTFTATARLAVEEQDTQVVDIDSVVSGMGTDLASLNTQLEVIRSRSLVRKLVEDQNLIADPDFNPYANTETSFSLRNYLTSNIRQLLGSPLPEEPEITREDEIKRTTSVVQSLVRATGVRATYLIDIHFTSTHPGKSIVLANRLAELYLEDQVQRKFEATEYAISFLSDRVSELRTELQTRENEIKELRARSSLISRETLDSLNIRLKEARTQAEEAEAELARRKSTLSRLQALRDQNDVEGFLQESGDPILRSALQRANGAVNQTVLGRVTSILSERQSEIARLEARTKALAENAQNLAKQSDAQSADLIQLNELSREVEATRILYETFLARLKEATVQVGLQKADSRILSEAIRARLVAPQRTRTVVMWAFFGTLIGAGIVLARHFMPSGVRTAGELELTSGMPVLGQVPRAPFRKRKDLVGYLVSNATSPTAEAIRNLRTSISMSNPDHPPQVILVTSSVPGEGKTTVSIALAQQFGALDKRVLLLEGDMRRMTLMEYTGGKGDDGFVPAMLGDTGIDSSVLHWEKMGVDVLLSGRTHANPADIFASEKFGAFMQTLRSRYDIIVIDTPPVLVVPDTRLIGPHVDAAIYAVKWNNTPSHQFQDGINELTSVGINVVGTVLTQVDAKGMKRYGYGDRYGAYSNYGGAYYGNMKS